MGEDVHKLQSLNGEKANPGIDQQKTKKDDSPAANHEQQGDHFRPGPTNAAGKESVGQDNHRLDETAKTGEVHFTPEHQENLVSWPHQDPAELAIADHLGTSVTETPETVTQRTARQTRSKAYEHLLK